MITLSHQNPPLECLLLVYCRHAAAAAAAAAAVAAAAAAKSLQSCPTLCNPIDGGPLSLGFSRQEH